MSLRFKSLQVLSYRQLKDLVIEKLGDVNLIVGTNNSGKSTFLEAVRLLASKGSPSLLEDVLISHGEFQVGAGGGEGELAEGRVLANLFFGRRFPEDDGEPIVISEVNGGNSIHFEHIALRDITEEREVEGEIETVRRLKRISKPVDASEEDVVEALEIRYSSDNTSPSGSRGIAIPLTDFFNGRRVTARARFEEASGAHPVSYVGAQSADRESLADLWDEVVLTEGENFALDALRIVEPATVGLAFVKQVRPGKIRPSGRPINERLPVIRLEGSAGPVPLGAMGDGMTRVLHLVLAALRARNGFLLIDEFENGLHYSIQEKIWSLLFSLAEINNIQVFCTTHSLDCVRAFSRVASDDPQVGQLIRFERLLETGETVTSIVDEEALDELLNSGVEVR